jgi:hypothetical protein
MCNTETGVWSTGLRYVDWLYVLEFSSADEILSEHFPGSCALLPECNYPIHRTGGSSNLTCTTNLSARHLMCNLINSAIIDLWSLCRSPFSTYGQVLQTLRQSLKETEPLCMTWNDFTAIRGEWSISEFAFLTVCSDTYNLHQLFFLLAELQVAGLFFYKGWYRKMDFQNTCKSFCFSVSD